MRCGGALVTSTTVGYGDHFPVTNEGRAVAVVLMLIGIGVFAVVPRTGPVERRGVGQRSEEPRRSSGGVQAIKTSASKEWDTVLSERQHRGAVDDWELDDWEGDAFDEDAWDATQIDVEADDWSEDELEGGGSGEGGSAGADGGGAVSWSAWEVGTVFALGGWLADRHSQQVGEQVREALERARVADALPRHWPRGAPHPPPPSGYAYGESTASLRVGDVLDQGALFRELALAGGQVRDLLVQAEGRTEAGGRLMLVASVVPRTPGPSMWVVAEEHAGGFSAARLVPVFQSERDGGLAVFASDRAIEATEAAAWACAREGVALRALTVTKHVAG